MKGAGYTGIWSAADEHWFQRRLSNIHNGTEGPLNGGEWKQKLKRQKKAGALADLVEARSWEILHKKMIEESE